MELTLDFIKTKLAKNETIYKRGENIYFLGNFRLKEINEKKNSFFYGVDGSYGEYNIEINYDNENVITKCDCPYPYKGCKHTIAACLDIINKQKLKKFIDPENPNEKFLTTEEIRKEAIESREKNAKKEKFKFIEGDAFKGEHYVRNEEGKEYVVTIYDPVKSFGHCTCPDFSTNRLQICKHVLYAINKLQENADFAEQSKNSVFPLIHFIWNSCEQKPQVYYEEKTDDIILPFISENFDEKFLFKKNDISLLYDIKKKIENIPNVKFDDYLLKKINSVLLEKEIQKEKSNFKKDLSFLKVKLFPYQEIGVDFALFKKSAIIADEMGLGKTIQAIAIAILKKKIFNFKKILVVTPSSLKEQWRLEIKKFTDESAIVVSGTYKKRQQIYEESNYFFKITNYEAVLRDIPVIKRYKPDLIILDEAQRIKNFDTKTHKVILSIPHQHSLVITGTPLENKLEDLYSIIQFADGELLSPLWIFATKHFNISRITKNKVIGYKNLNEVHEKIKDLVIRRKKEDVFESLPEVTVNTYRVGLTIEQDDIHSGYMRKLSFYLEKKFLTPIDIQRMQEILMCMRMVCDSTYLIDKKTNFSPKLIELKSVLNEIVIQNKRKAVIFSEWTTMTFLIAKLISELKISFVELSGKVPVDKRQRLIDEFNNNPDCMIFLSTDAGGVGLNLQSADCVINFELPWNPAKLNQRIGRVNRIGQKSKNINVVNFVSVGSIEESVLAGIELKQNLFNSVLNGTGNDEVNFTQEEKNKFINRIRAMFGEKLDEIKKEKQPGEKIPEETPGYLNPKILNVEEEVDITAEEAVNESSDTGEEEIKEAKEEERVKIEHEKLEKALDYGMKFLNTLSQMTTGKSLVEDENQKSITVDKNTGEVIFKFKLPGF